MSPAIVCMGEPMIEFNESPDGAYLRGFGGDTSNVAIAAARQGASVGYVTALGQDIFGDAFIALWSRENVDASRVLRRPDAPTAVYFVTHDAAGHHFAYYRAGSAASRFSPAEVPVDYIAGAKILQLSGISQAIGEGPREACFRAIDIARDAGVRVAYDANLRQRLWPIEAARAVIHRAMALADIALPSLDDARQLVGTDDADRIVDFYLALGPGIVALKLGAAGALIATREARRRLAPYPVKAIDATGAGDAFDGAFLARLVAGDDAFAAGAYANAAAALSATGLGAVAPIPRPEEVRKLLAGG